MQSNQTTKPFLRIGTRGSLLALAQAKLVQSKLAKFHKVETTDIHIEVIKTSGDIIQDRPLSEVGGKGLFTKEIEVALLENRVDIGVHSSKDVATQLPDGLGLYAFLKREDVRDAFVSLKHKSLDDMPEGAIFGTSSLRRAAQMLRHRPDLKIVEFRGNVQTRMKKLEAGVADATLLAYAGLRRLGQTHIAKQMIDPNVFMPAPAQGAIGIECREDDTRTRELITVLNHAGTAAALVAERHFLHGLDGSCRTPIGAYTEIDGNDMKVIGQILSINGTTAFEGEVTGHVADCAEIGQHLAQILREQAGENFFESFEVR
ncbi:hydroxymethylbilane synthase [Maritalea porphyrae]|uniref:hydroxymethylbilane synthase n=1 Tax=Maritalea porphyrae TaxID=880732 RepID=UPI0024E0BED8|nr:hydroxymethylbilane synthase [Maritalea porphyrae]